MAPIGPTQRCPRFGTCWLGGAKITQCEPRDFAEPPRRPFWPYGTAETAKDVVRKTVNRKGQHKKKRGRGVQARHANRTGEATCRVPTMHKYGRFNGTYHHRAGGGLMYGFSRHAQSLPATVQQGLLVLPRGRTEGYCIPGEQEHQKRGKKELHGLRNVRSWIKKGEMPNVFTPQHPALSRSAPSTGNRMNLRCTHLRGGGLH